MSIYAISDIHGCYDELQDLLSKISFSENDELYVLGDLIDRGPKSDKCIEWIINSDDNVHFLWGNHEQMMMWSIREPWSTLSPYEEIQNPWLLNGGDETLSQLKTMPDKTLINDFHELLLSSTKIKSLRIKDKTIVLSHAGIRPPMAFDDEDGWMYQAEEDLLWIGMEWWLDPEIPPFDVVFGHSSTYGMVSHLDKFHLASPEILFEGSRNRIMQWNKKHAIDCSCAWGGNLGILRLDDWATFHVPCQKPGGYINVDKYT